jgi:hypothetical protein
LHRGHAAVGGGIPRRRQNGAAPRRETLHYLMGPPVNHGAFLFPGRIPIPVGSRPGTRMSFSVLGDFFADRFKELNTYSGCLTRCITPQIWQLRPAFARE